VKKPNIILWDLEILADMKEVRKVFFSIGDYPGRTLKSSINSVICFGWKRLGEKSIRCANAWDYSRWRKNINDDYSVVKCAREVLAEADGIVTHNGSRFDLPFIRGRIAYHGFKPLPPIPHIDTCKLAKKLFLYSASLKNTGAFLGCKSAKIDTGGAKLWERVAEREARAMKEMTAYCKGDVSLLEEILVRLQSHSKDLPNFNLFNEKKDSCPRCGEEELVKQGPRPRAAGRVQTYQCKACGGWSTMGKQSKIQRAI
jgi:hypothetical protein